MVTDDSNAKLESSNKSILHPDEEFMELVAVRESLDIFSLKGRGPRTLGWLV